MTKSMRREGIEPHPHSGTAAALTVPELLRVVGYWICDRETASMTPAELRRLAAQFTEQAYARLDSARCALELADRKEGEDSA